MVEAFGNIVGNIVGGYFGQQANAHGLMLSEEAQKRLMKYQAKLNYKYSQKDLLSKYINGRRGLESAGYNPMLALSGINSNSNWASQASVSDIGAGTSFNSGVANALTQQQVEQQGALNESTIDNNNADSLLKEQQAFTEQNRQLLIDAQTQLTQSEKVLNDKNASWYDRREAMNLKRQAQEVKTMATQSELNVATAGKVRSEIGVAKMNAISNALDVDNRFELGKEANDIARKNLPPKWAGTIGGILGTGVGAGLGVYSAIRGSGSVKPVNFKTSVPYR